MREAMPETDPSAAVKMGMFGKEGERRGRERT